jgi:hypothetical protein
MAAENQVAYFRWAFSTATVRLSLSSSPSLPFCTDEIRREQAEETIEAIKRVEPVLKKLWEY